MEKIKSLWRRCSNLGFEETIYENYRDEVRALNRKMVQTSSFIGTVMMLILTISSMVVSAVSKVLPLYFATAIIFMAIYLSLKYVKKQSTALVLFCNYSFLSVAFIFAIGLDMLQKSITATTICVLLVALPLLVVDKPIREIFYFAGVVVVFILEVVLVKHNGKESIDILNALSFGLIGIFLGYKNNQMMLENIRGNNLLEIERDKDSLTSLYNKGAMEKRAGSFLKTENAAASMMVLDLDDFKYVNDTYGHNAGDQILISIGELLASLFRSTDVVSRFGGDEFTIFMPLTNDKEILKKKAEQILEGVKNIRIAEDPEYRAHICLGIATSPECGTAYEKLFKNADTALYKVKRNGKNGYEFYNPNERKTILLVDDVEVNRQVLKAILEKNFDIVEAEDGTSALEKLESSADIALVITDIQMPHMSGIELIKRIRTNPRWNDVSIIANTQYGDMKQEQEIYGLGVSDFVYKPASPGAIQLRVRNVMKANENN